MKGKKYMVIFQPSGIRGKVDDGVTIMEASRELGADIESLCGGKATCGKCRIKIEEGEFRKYGITSKIESVSPISEGDRKLLSKQQLRDNYRLACQTRIRGDVVIFVPEESRKGQQVIRKDAGARDIRLKPAVKKYHVTLTPATLHDNIGDFERLQTELAERFKLRELTIDYPVLLRLQNLVRETTGRLPYPSGKTGRLSISSPGRRERATVWRLTLVRRRLPAISATLAAVRSWLPMP